MSAHIRAEPAPSRRRPTAPFRRRLGGLAAVALAALIQGCTATPHAPFNGPDPSNPHARVPVVGYRSTIGSYESRRPVEPVPWREQNERVAPAPKQ